MNSLVDRRSLRSRSAPWRRASRPRSASALGRRRLRPRRRAHKPRRGRAARIGAERQHPHHVEPRADAAVGEDRQLPPIASAIAGNARALDSTPSSWRPPWLETTMPSAPLAAASRASSGSRMPLMMNGPSHCARTHSRSFQVTVASKLSRDQPMESASTCPCRANGSRLPSVCGRPRTQRPTPSAGRREWRIRLAARAAAQPGAIVAVARAGHRQVDGEAAGRRSLPPRPRDHVAEKPRSLMM